MSQSSGPQGPSQPPVPARARYEARRQGSALGFDFDAGVRVTSLADALGAQPADRPAPEPEIPAVEVVDDA